MPQSKWTLEQVVFGGVIHLDEGLTTIGRSVRSTIVASSDYVSRNHAQICISPNSSDIRIIDLGSKNGIYVNEFQYCNVECSLNVGDRIGIGVDVDDIVVSNSTEGMYPIYLLKRLPEEPNNEIPLENLEKIQSNASNVPHTSTDPPGKENEKHTSSINENDTNNEKDNIPISQQNSVAEVVAIIKKEPESLIKTNIICENIKSIFGELNSELLSTLSEETRKIAESTRHMKKPVVCKDIICISSSEDEDCDTDYTCKRQLKVKSPELFNVSLNSDKDNNDIANQSVVNQTDSSLIPMEAINKQPNIYPEHPVEVENPQQLNPAQVIQNKTKQNPPISPEPNELIQNNVPTVIEHENQIVEAIKVPDNNQPITESVIKNMKDDFDDDEDDAFFTQKLYEDMKELAEDLINDEIADVKIEPEDSDSILSIKQEIYPQWSLDGTIINLDDEDDFDEDLESKVHDWSVKLTKSSQSFSNSFNASQVFEDNHAEEEVVLKTRNIFLDDDDDEIDFVDRAAAIAEVKTEPESCEAHVRPDKSSLISTEREKHHEKDVRNLQKSLFSSTSEEEDENEAVDEQPSTSALSLKKFNDKLVRRLSTSEEIPKKKARLNSRSENNENEDVRHSSSSHRTYSRKDSERKRSHSSIAKEDSPPKEDRFDKLKENDESKHRKSSSSSLKNTIDHTNSNKQKSSSNVHHHSIPGADLPQTSIYKSATVARMNHVGSNSLTDQNDAEDFVEYKKCQVEPTKKNEETKRPEPQVPVTTISKTIRGPPEIIQPPILPVNKGKLRGISATHKRIAEKLKAVTNTKELKRKWLEKPSSKKDKEKTKAIQEDRKKKLKELNDRKQSENENNAAKKVPTKEPPDADEKEASRKKLKVKVTQNNRGAFLAELPAKNPKPHYTIPKKTSNGFSKSTSKISPVKIAQTKPAQQQKPRIEIINNFAMELAQADTVLQRQKCRDRTKSTDVVTEQKQCAPPRRNSKKVNFTSMIKDFDENNRILAGRTRRVTFKLPPEIRYFESESSAKLKGQQKESSTFLERKTIVRKRYAILDKTDNLLDDILSWSQLWLQNKHHNINMLVFPMTNDFKSFGEYKSIVLPLLKMEYLAHLEKAMEQNVSRSHIVAEIDYSAPHKHRDYLFAKCNTHIKPSELSFNDLALIDVAFGGTTIQYFGFISNIRKSGTYNYITIEITANIIKKDVVKAKPKIIIRRIIDGILLYLSTFNAVHQLEETPLVQKILNPMELLSNTNNYRSSCIEYKGFNALNKEQLDILLKAYEKAIYESNPNISLINGPPGTGKSVLISNLVIQLLYGNEVNELDKKILICAQSNMAVDVIAEKLIKIKQRLSPETTQFNVVRFGIDEKVHPNVKGITLKSLLNRHRMSILRKQANLISDQAVNEENLNIEIIRLEAQIAEMEKHNYQDVRQEELIEMRKNLALKKNIVNQVFRPEDEKRLYKWFLENANIVCSTLSSCVKLASFVDYFDVCIIDEATQCTEPWALMPLRFGVSNLIMVGDTQQLPATVISQRAKELGLETSLFTRIKKCLENDYKETPNILNSQNKPIFTLHEQYRMNSEISKWPNMYFYKNQLRNNPKTDEFKSSIRPFSILNLEYKQNDTYYGQISISNNLEAEFVAKLVTTLDNYIPNKFYSYGIITPYAQHREKLEKMIKNSGLKDIMVNTIDSYQGIEKDVIIISNARTHGVGFLGNYQRLNVALTRPRKCLIVCGNFKNLECVPSWSSLLANAKERGLYHNISPMDASDMTKNVIEKIKIKR